MEHIEREPRLNNVTSRHGGMKIGIIGGGIMGVASGYYLSKMGHEVTIFEEKSSLGGLSECFQLENDKYLEKYHHFISSNDDFLTGLLDELKITGELSWNNTKLGAYRNSKLYNFTGVFDMLRYSCIGIYDRFKFLFSMFLLQQKKNWKKLDNVSAVGWIVKNSGDKVYENIWKDLFEKKFDKHVKEIPAAWFWARTSRRAKNRDIFSAYEKFGYFRNSIRVLFEALKGQITLRKGSILLNSRVEKVIIKNRKTQGLVCNGKAYDFNAVLLTVPIPRIRQIAPESLEGLPSKMCNLPYAAIINTVIELKKSFSEYFWLNICEPDIPFPGVIEFSRLRPPTQINGNHFIYIPNYVSNTNRLYSFKTDELFKEYLPHLMKINPGLSKDDIVNHWSFKEEHADPYYFLGYSECIPDFNNNISGLFIANTSQIYPLTRSINNGINYAMQASEIIGHWAQKT